MAELTSYQFKPVYKTGKQNILTDFYVPALMRSVRYDRAVGFFSPVVISLAAQGLAAFIKNDGKMRLIFGAEVTPEEAEKINEGYVQRELLDKLGRDYIESLHRPEDALFEKRLEALCWMIATGHLDVKV